VPLQPGGDDAFYRLLLVHDAAEVAQVLPALLDGLGGIGRADPLVTGDDRGGVQRGARENRENADL
jgi:hypothetical protein